MQLASASAAIDAVARGTSGPLRIASFPGATGAMLPDALLRLRSQRPDLAVSVEDREATEALSGLRDGTIDLAVVADFSPDGLIQTDGLEVASLGRATVSVMLPVGHRLAEREVIDLVELLDESWIQSGDALCAQTVARGSLGPEASPGIARHTKSLDATRGLVAAGLGIALVSTLSGGDAQAGAVIRPVRPVPEYSVLAVLPPSVSVLPSARALRDLLAVTARGSLALGAQHSNSGLETPDTRRVRCPRQLSAGQVAADRQRMRLPGGSTRSSVLTAFPGTLTVKCRRAAAPGGGGEPPRLCQVLTRCQAVLADGAHDDQDVRRDDSEEVDGRVRGQQLGDGSRAAVVQPPRPLDAQRLDGRKVVRDECPHGSHASWRRSS